VRVVVTEEVVVWCGVSRWWRVTGMMIGWVCWERAVPRLVLQHARLLALLAHAQAPKPSQG
jgi:hypothetical protein